MRPELQFSGAGDLLLPIESFPVVDAIKEIIKPLRESKFNKEAREILQSVASLHRIELINELEARLETLPIADEYKKPTILNALAKKGDGANANVASMKREDKAVVANLLYWKYSTEILEKSDDDKLTLKAIFTFLGVSGGPALRDLLEPVKFKRSCDNCGAAATVTVPYMSSGGNNLVTIRCENCSHADAIWSNSSLASRPKLLCACNACKSEVGDAKSLLGNLARNFEADLITWIEVKQNEIVARAKRLSVVPAVGYYSDEFWGRGLHGVGAEEVCRALLRGEKVQDSVGVESDHFFHLPELQLEDGAVPSLAPLWLERLWRVGAAELTDFTIAKTPDEMLQRFYVEPNHRSRYGRPPYENWLSAAIESLRVGDFDEVEKCFGLCHYNYYDLPHINVGVTVKAAPSERFVRFAERFEPIEADRSLRVAELIAPTRPEPAMEEVDNERGDAVSMVEGAPDGFILLTQVRGEPILISVDVVKLVKPGSNGRPICELILAIEDDENSGLGKSRYTSIKVLESFASVVEAIGFACS